MASNTKVVIGILLFSLVAIVGGAIALSSATQPKSVDVSRVTGDVRWQKGNSEASITIVEFSDFQCPACRSSEPEINRVVEEYSDQVRFVYRHFPLTNIHGNALDAAIATEIAGEQGSFWQMHDLLFERQDEWKDTGDVSELFSTYAEELGLNKEAFFEDIRNRSYEERVRADMEDARLVGVNATPTIFIGDQRVQVPDLASVLSELVGRE